MNEWIIKLVNERSISKMNSVKKKKSFVSLKLTDNLVLLNHLFDFHMYLFQWYQQSKYLIYIYI